MVSCNGLLGIEEPLLRGGAPGAPGGLGGSDGKSAAGAADGGTLSTAGAGASGEGGLAASAGSGEAGDSGARPIAVGGSGGDGGAAGETVTPAGGSSAGQGDTSGGRHSGGAGLGGGGSGGCGDDGTTRVGPALTTARSCSSASSCGDHDCCQRLFVEGGDFVLDGTIPARVADFYLDQHEVTVARFRQFLAEYAGPPAPEDGAHPLIEGSGWSEEWMLQVPESNAAAEWDRRLTICEYVTWTPAPGANERKPISCVNWYEAFAFCAWDGGRLPTEAEWAYAAGGGCGARLYPWGDAAPTSALATFTLLAIVNVGTKPAGMGRWGHQELAGSVAEWVLDFNPGPQNRSNNYPYLACDNCANLVPTTARSTRGGGFTVDDDAIKATSRVGVEPVLQRGDTGFRCAVSAEL